MQQCLEQQHLGRAEMEKIGDNNKNLFRKRTFYLDTPFFPVLHPASRTGEGIVGKQVYMKNKLYRLRACTWERSNKLVHANGLSKLVALKLEYVVLCQGIGA